MQETRVRSLGQEDSLEKEMATHSSVLAWSIPGTGEAWWAAVYGVTQNRTRLKQLSSSSSVNTLGVQNVHTALGDLILQNSGKTLGVQNVRTALLLLLLLSRFSRVQLCATP